MDNLTKLKRLIFGAITNKVDESFAMTMSSYFIKKLSNPQFKSAIVFALSKNPDIIDSLNKANADIVRKTTQIIVREITPTIQNLVEYAISELSIYRHKRKY
jgi:accessory colonization factor AcfC